MVSGWWKYTRGEAVYVQGIETFDLNDPRIGCGQWMHGWGCTRPTGHPGRHFATAGLMRVFAAWPGEHEPTPADLGTAS